MAVARANGGVNDFGFNSASGAALVTVPCPTAVATGNYLVAHYCTNDDIGTDHTVSGGSATAWTNVIPFTKVSTLGSISVWIKKAEAADVGATFTFSLTGDTGKNNAFISAWTGVDDANPYTVGTVGSVTSGTTISYPGLTPTVDDVMVLLLGGVFNALNGTLDEPSVDGVTSTLISENPSGGTNAAWVDVQQTFALMTGHNGTAIPTVTGNVAVAAAATLGVMLALNPPGGGGGPATETLEPDSVVGTPQNLTPSTGAALAALQAVGGAYMMGTDPGGGGGSSNNNYADAQTTATGVANQLTSPANAVGSSEATTSVTTGAVQNTDYANFFTFDETALAAAIPSNATITAFTVRLRDTLNNLARGDVGVRVDSTNGTQIEAEDTAKTGLGTSLPAAGTGVHTYAMTTLPTRTQIVAASFGVRVRYRRTASQAASYTLDWLRLEITYTTPGSTTPTSVRVTLQNPVNPLVTGAGTGVITAVLRKLGSGTSPTANIRIRRAGSNTDVGASSAITVSQASFTAQTYTFDQSILSGNGSDVEIVVDSAGAAGGLMEVDYIKWVAQTAAAAAAPVHRRIISRAALVRSNRY